jgi:hypothetical protein
MEKVMNVRINELVHSESMEVQKNVSNFLAEAVHFEEAVRHGLQMKNKEAVLWVLDTIKNPSSDMPLEKDWQLCKEGITNTPKSDQK